MVILNLFNYIFRLCSKVNNLFFTENISKMFIMQVNLYKYNPEELFDDYFTHPK